MLTIDHEGPSAAVAQVKGRLDSSTAREFGADLVDLINAGCTRLIVDLSGVIYISSAGFRSLLMAAKQMEDRAGKLALCGLNPEVKRLFDLGAFTELFVICATREDCINQLT